MKHSDGKQSREFVRFVVADLDGRTFDLEPDSLGDCPLLVKGQPEYRLLRQFVANEVQQGAEDARPPKHIEYMRRHELLDYCDISEKGHFKWYPKGLMMQKLLLDYAARLSREWGAFAGKFTLIEKGLLRIRHGSSRWGSLRRLRCARSKHRHRSYSSLPLRWDNCPTLNLSIGRHHHQSGIFRRRRLR